MSGELPHGWIWATLGEVCHNPQYGWTTKANKTGSLRLVRTTDITSGTINWYTVPFCENEPEEKEKYLLKDGDIVISRAGSIGYSLLIKSPQHSVFASYLIRFIPLIDENFVAYFLKSPYYWNFISESKIGIAVPNVNATKLKQVSIPIAPLQEQYRIVTKIEELFTKLDVGIEALKQVHAQLKRYRQSVLKAAVEGRLTAEWRQQHLDELEPADKLLERILKECRKNWEVEQLAKYEAEGKTPPKNWRDKYKEPTPPDTKDLPDLPEEWIWSSMDQIIDVLTDYHANGSYKILKSNVHIKKEPDYAVMVRAVNLVKNDFAEELRYISKHAYNFLKKSKLEGEEIIIGKIGNAGEVYYMPKLKVPTSLGMNLFIVRIVRNLVNKYVYNHLTSLHSKIEIKRRVKGVGNPTIDKKSIRSLSIALPPIQEQKFIVKMIEYHFSIADEVNDITKTELKRAQSLRQAILKYAFEGKLVPQDPNDLPAPRPGKYFIYVLECSNGSHYIGHTENIEKRWCDHAGGRGADWTRKYPPIALVHWEEYNSRADAAKREKELKTGFGRKWIKREIKEGRARQAGEPASVLLERIKAEKAKSKKSKQLEMS